MNVIGQGEADACNDFLLGVNNAHSLAAGVWKKPVVDFLWCLPDRVNASEVVKPIVDLIDQKPELASQPEIVAIYGVWAKAFLCKKQRDRFSRVERVKCVDASQPATPPAPAAPSGQARAARSRLA
jgi:hypothetical protein